VHPGLTITAAELVPETFECFRYFHPGFQDVLEKDSVRLVSNDGRNHLLLFSKKYDVISVDPAPPIWSAGTVNLYTKEFFQLCKDNLTPQGVMCLWFPGGRPEDERAIFRTFREVFPEITVWKGPHNWGFYCVGTTEKMPWIDFKQNVENAFKQPAIVQDLGEYDTSCLTPDQVYRLQVDRTQVDDFSSRGALITDDYPFTEFFLWRQLLK